LGILEAWRLWIDENRTDHIKVENIDIDNLRWRFYNYTVEELDKLK
jgi:hypothetical protein